MKLNDVLRLDDLIVRINNIISRRLGRISGFRKLEGDIEESLVIDEPDLGFLIQHGVIIKVTPDEVRSRYGLDPEYFQELRKILEVEGRSKRLGEIYAPLEKKHREWPNFVKGDPPTEYLDMSYYNTVKELFEILGDTYPTHAYNSLSNVIKTDKGDYIIPCWVYYKNQRHMKGLCDIFGEPWKDEVRTYNNILQGRLATYFITAPYAITRSDEVNICMIEGADYPPVPKDHSRYGEDLELQIDIPLKKLTLIDDISPDVIPISHSRQSLDDKSFDYLSKFKDRFKSLLANALRADSPDFVLCNYYHTHHLGDLVVPDGIYYIETKVTDAQLRIIKEEKIDIDKDPKTHTPFFELYMRLFEGSFRFNLLLRRTAWSWPQLFA